MSNKKSSGNSVRGDSGAEVHGRGRIKENTVTPEMVEQRARELALIAGREPDHPTESDRIQAKEELLGDDAADRPADDADIQPSGMGAPPTSTGHQTEKLLPTDDENETRLVQEGIDAAEHDEMVAAGKTQTRSEG